MNRKVKQGDAQSSKAISLLIQARQALAAATSLCLFDPCTCLIEKNRTIIVVISMNHRGTIESPYEVLATSLPYLAFSPQESLERNLMFRNTNIYGSEMFAKIVTMLRT